MKYPHWIVGDVRTSSQMNAWRAHQANPLASMQFYFFEEEYDTLDWTKEPTESWEELCYKKCVLLRQKYKKLSLFYSGGRDSHHILRMFSYNKIPLDEIILIDWEMLPTRRFELTAHITPQVHHFLKLSPGTKVTTLRVGAIDYAKYFTDAWPGQNTTTLMNGMFSPASFDYLISVKLFGMHNWSTGYILGNDKPRIILEDGKYYSVVLDKTLEHYMSGAPNFEMFYYSPDMPELHLKQTWMSLSHVEKMHTSKLTPNFFSEYYGNSKSVYYDDFCISCGRGPAFDLTLSIQNGRGKRTGGRDSELGTRLHADAGSGVPYANYFLENMDYLARSMPDAFNKSDPYCGTRGIYSKKYYMKDSG